MGRVLVMMTLVYCKVWSPSKRLCRLAPLYLQWVEIRSVLMGCPLGHVMQTWRGSLTVTLSPGSSGMMVSLLNKVNENLAWSSCWHLIMSRMPRSPDGGCDAAPGNSVNSIKGKSILENLQYVGRYRRPMDDMTGPVPAK